MDFLISALLAILIIILLCFAGYSYEVIFIRKRFEKQKRERNLSLEEAISRVKSGDGWLLTYDDHKLWKDEFFWLQSDIPPDEIFDLEELVRTKAYYVVRQNSFRDTLEQISKSVGERFVICHYLELRDPA